jgi:error-prone DNA polymerase
MTLEYEVLGLLTGDHVMTLYRPRLAEQGILGTQDLTKCANGQRIRLAGLLVVHQAPPTAKGYHFLTLEDEAGLIDVIFRPQVVTHTKKLPKRQDYGLNKQILLLVEGTVQRSGNTVNILAIKLQPLLSSTIANVAAAQVRASSE